MPRTAIRSEEGAPLAVTKIANQSLGQHRLANRLDAGLALAGCRVRRYVEYVRRDGVSRRGAASEDLPQVLFEEAAGPSLHEITALVERHLADQGLFAVGIDLDEVHGDILRPHFGGAVR